jgi:hypothetical protein
MVRDGDDEDVFRLVAENQAIRKPAQQQPSGAADQGGSGLRVEPGRVDDSLNLIRWVAQ